MRGLAPTPIPRSHHDDRPAAPNTNDEPTPDETFTWSSSDAPHGEPAGAGAGSTSGPTGSAGASAAGSATAILESIRDAVDDLAERASPTVREFSARTAEFAADAAEKASPIRDARRRRDRGCERQARLEVAFLGGGGPRLDDDATTAHDTGDTPGAAAPDSHAPAADDAPVDGPTPA